MDFGIYAGDTSKTIYLRLRDSTTGLGKTGLVYNSTGVTCSYTLPIAARAAITLVTQTVTGSWSSGGFVEIDATNCKGLYRLDLPNAAIASGAYTVISIEFDGIIEESIEIPLHYRQVDVVQIGSVTQSATDLRDFADSGYDPATNKVQGVVLVDTTTTNTDMVGTDSAALASVCTEGRLAELDAGNLPTDIAAIPTTAMRGTDSAALASVCTEGRLAELDAANMPADIDAIPTTAMRGTDSAALATVCTEGRLAELDAGNLPTDIAAIPTTAMRGTDNAALATALATAQTDLDTITGSDWVTLATTQGNYAPSLASALATAQADLDTITGTDGVTLATAQALYAPAIPSEVLAQVNAALDTAIAELGVAAPTATPTIRTGLMLLYMALRNKAVVQTSGTDALEIYNTAGTKIAAKLLTDDGTDYTEAEMA